MMRKNCKRTLQILLLITAAGLFMLSAPATAAVWPGVEKALQQWDGSRDITLRSGLEDPIGSAVVQGLLEQLLAEGFQPTLAGLETTVKKGLILDLRDSKDGMVAILTDAESGRVLGLDRQPATAPSQPAVGTAAENAAESEEPAPEPPPVVVKPVVPERSPPAKNLLAHPLELPWPTKRFVLAEGDMGQGPVLAMLTDETLRLVRLEGGTAQALDSWTPDIPAGRALYVGAGDIDGDGRREIAAVWAEDLRGIYQGTESRPHAWVFRQSEGVLTLLSDDLEAFIRVVDGRLLMQRRGTFAPFAGPVLPVEWAGGKFRVSTEPVWPEGRDLYAVTPLPQKSRALFWTGDSRLLLGTIAEGGEKELVADLGTVNHPAVAVPLRETEYRSGLEKEDRINERYFALPRRIVVDEDGAALTFVRGRSAGLPLVGSLSGQDQVVKILAAPEGLTLENPYPGVESFILDVAPLSGSNQSGVLVLVNDRPDGTGKARLLRQSSR